MPRYRVTFTREARAFLEGAVEVEADTIDEAENVAETLLMQGRVNFTETDMEYTVPASIHDTEEVD